MLAACALIFKQFQRRVSTPEALLIRGARYGCTARSTQHTAGGTRTPGDGLGSAYTCARDHSPRRHQTANARGLVCELPQRSLICIASKSHATNMPCFEFRMFRIGIASNSICFEYALLRLSHVSNMPRFELYMLRICIASNFTCLEYVLLRVLHASTMRCFEFRMFRIRIASNFTCFEYAVPRISHASNMHCEGEWSTREGRSDQGRKATRPYAPNSPTRGVIYTHTGV